MDSDNRQGKNWVGVGMVEGKGEKWGTSVILKTNKIIFLNVHTFSATFLSFHFF